jgi:hypothetical protein
MTDKGVRDLALEIFEHHQLNFYDVLKRNVQQNISTFELEMNNVVYSFKCNNAGKYHFLSIKRNDEFLLVYSACED